MSERITYINNDECWVYLTPSKTSSGYDVVFEMDLPHKIEREKIYLLYFRKFDNLLDGLAHKLLLETISRQSLLRIVKNSNPDNRDLTSEILKETYIK